MSPKFAYVDPLLVGFESRYCVQVPIKRLYFLRISNITLRCHKCIKLIFIISSIYVGPKMYTIKRIGDVGLFCLFILP